MPSDPSSHLDDLRLLEGGGAVLDTFREHGGEVVPVGSFSVLFSSGAFGFNYAAPLEPLGDEEEVRHSVDELRAVFRERALPLSIEFNEPLFPTLAPILEGEGLVVDQREPLLLLRGEDFRPITNPEVEVAFISPTAPDTDLIAFWSIFDETLLELPPNPTPERVERLRGEIERIGGKGHALARLQGDPVGTGFISASEGVCEITRVGTLPQARRKGVAATVTTFLLEQRFSAGDRLAWLTASGEPAQRLYQKLGFRLVGDRLYFKEGQEG